MSRAAPLGQHSSEVDSMSEAMPRQVLTAQLIVDKHYAMVLANVTFKALAAIWHRRTFGGSSIRVITDTIKMWSARR